MYPRQRWAENGWDAAEAGARQAQREAREEKSSADAVAAAGYYG